MLVLDDAPLYIAGIDLALRAKHVVRLVDDRQRPVGAQIAFGRTYEEFQTMYKEIAARVPEGSTLVWGFEGTGAAWRQVSACLRNEGQLVSMENPAAIAGHREVERRYLKTDKVDALAIAEFVGLRMMRGKPLHVPPSAHEQALRSLARNVEHFTAKMTQEKGRLLSLLCDTLLPALDAKAHEWASPTLLRVLDKFADVREIAGKKLPAFIKTAKKAGGPGTSEAALTKLHAAAQDAVTSYGDTGLLYETHAAILCELIATVRHLEGTIQRLRQQLTGLLEQQRSAEQVDCALSVPGVGQASLDKLMAFYGADGNWPSIKALKQIAGTVPTIVESATSAGTQRMSKLGEPILRQIIFQIGNTARLCDAEFAATYYRQMVENHKNHAAACIGVGLRVLNILRAVLRDCRPFQYRDPETGEQISKEQSKQLASGRYRVPPEIRAERRKRRKDEPPVPPRTSRDPRTDRRNQEQPQPPTQDASARDKRKETAQAGHAQMKDMPEHSRRRAVDLR